MLIFLMSFALAFWPSQPTPLENAPALNKLQSEIYLVDFWASWCSPCEQTFPLYKKYLPQLKEGVTFISISVDEDKAATLKMLNTHSLPAKNYWDPERKIAKHYQLKALPTLLVLDAKGKVLESLRGFNPENPKEHTDLLKKYSRP